MSTFEREFCIKLTSYLMGVRIVRFIYSEHVRSRGPERSERSGRVLGGPTGPGVGSGSPLDPSDL